MPEKDEGLREWIAEQFYGGYCEPEDRGGYKWQCALENADQILAKAKPIIEMKQAKEFNKIITPLRGKLAEIDGKLNDRETDLIEAKKQERGRIREDILGGKPVGLTNDKGDMIFPTGYDIPANSFIYFVSQEGLQALKDS